MAFIELLNGIQTSRKQRLLNVILTRRCSVWVLYGEQWFILHTIMCVLERQSIVKSIKM